MSLTNRLLIKLRLFETDFFAWLCYLFIISLFFSRAGLAISSVLLFAHSLVFYFKKPFKVALQPIHFLLFAIYTAYLVSVLFHAQNLNYGSQLLFKNAVFIILPLTFIFSKELSVKAFHRILLLYFFLAVICVSINTTDALLHFNQFLEDVSNSKNIIPIIGPAHSELGLLSTVAFILGFYLVKGCTNPQLKFLLFCLLALLFVALHIIAYRFSLITIYLIIAFYGISELVKRRNIKLAAFSVLAFVVGVYSFALIPSVKKRLQNTVSDLTSITEHRNPNFQSVTQRFLAVNCALEVVKEHPWLGVSPVNTGPKMQEQYKKNSYLLIPENRMFIHNQFLYYVLCFGIPFGALVGLLLGVLVFKNAYTNPLLFWLLVPFFFHMMIENTLEKQITANAFIFLFLVLNRKGKSFTL